MAALEILLGYEAKLLSSFEALNDGTRTTRNVMG